MNNPRGHQVSSPQASRRRLPPALLYDIPVGVLVVVSWLLVGIAWAHTLAGLALIGMIVVHLATRRVALGRLARPPRGRRVRAVARRLGYGLFLVIAAAMVVTGLLRWVGVPSQDARHGIFSYSLLGVVAVHVWIVRRPLRARFRAERNE